MKVRSDFITNSSSSSFIAFAVPKDSVFSEDSYKILFQKALESTKDFYASYPKYKEEGEQQVARMEAMDDDEQYEYVLNESDFSDLLNNRQLEVGGMEGDWVGMTVSTIFEHYPDLKISEIKSMVKNTINKEFNTCFTEEDIMFVEEAWRDG